MSKSRHVYPIQARSKHEDVEKKVVWRTDFFCICKVNRGRKKIGNKNDLVICEWYQILWLGLCDGGPAHYLPTAGN